MKVLVALAFVAACSMAHAREKPVSTAKPAQPVAAAEVSDATVKVASRTEGSTAKLATPKGEAAGRDAYSVPLLRDARSMR